MTTFILVPGLWLGAWAWADVARYLRAAGHTVHPVTLSGLADRAHLNTGSLTLDDHVAAITGLIRYEELDEVVLVGPSGRGAAPRPPPTRPRTGSGPSSTSTAARSRTGCRRTT